MLIRFLIYILFFSIQIVLNQEMPPDLFDTNIKKIKYDAGENWESNSTLEPFRYNEYKNNNFNFQLIESHFGLKLKNTDLNFFNYYKHNLKSNIYIYMYGSINSKVESKNKFFNKKKYSLYKINLSGLGYSNDWIDIQFGKGFQNWGANHDIQLIMSDKSSPYTFGVLGLNLGVLRVRYFHGFLESDSNRINRYITGRGLEWTNKKTIIFSISEVVIYSGFERSLDFSYLNPMSTHLEIELNDRTNLVGSGNGNGIWQLSSDILLLTKIRISCNYLIDEFVLDKEQKNKGKASGRAYSYKIVYNPWINNDNIFSLFISRISVGTHTFRHQVGSNNFVQSGKPIGPILGSDFIEDKVGINILVRKDLLAYFNIGLIRVGQNNILDNPYDPYIDYLDGPFPSGKITSTFFVGKNIQYNYKNSFFYSFGVRYEKRYIEPKNFQNDSLINFYLNFSIHFKKKES